VGELAAAPAGYRNLVQGCGTGLLTELMQHGQLSVDVIYRHVDFWNVNAKGLNALLLLYDLPPLPPIAVGPRGPPSAKAIHEMTKRHFGSAFAWKYYA